MENEEEIRHLQKMVIATRKKTEKIEKDIEQLRNTHKAIKDMNDERTRKIQEENRELDSELASKEAALNKTREELETSVCEERRKLLRRIVLCNLKNLLVTVQKPQAPEYALSTIYAGRFVVVYDATSIGRKPVNSHEYKIEVKLADSEKHALRSLLEPVWMVFREIHWGWGDSSPTYFQRDFSSEQDAKHYGKRNKMRVCQTLIEGIKQVEKEIEDANKNIDAVFDFRLLDSSIQYDRERFSIASAKKHKLVLSPILTSYEKVVDKIEPYPITIRQQGYQLTISGHRFAGQARSIKYGIYRYFNTDFKAIEADTKQEILNPS